MMYHTLSYWLFNKRFGRWSRGGPWAPTPPQIDMGAVAPDVNAILTAGGLDMGSHHPPPQQTEHVANKPPFTVTASPNECQLQFY